MTTEWTVVAGAEWTTSEGDSWDHDRESYTLEMEFSTGVWTNVWAEAERPTPIVVERGISDPWGRMAEIGSLAFRLLNHENKYSPDHGSVQAGFEIGCGVRLRATYAEVTYDLFRGEIIDILPVPGEHHVKPTTVVIAYDDMDKLDVRRLKRLALQTSQRSDQIISAIAANVFTPIATDYDPGDDTYAFAGDTWRDEKTSGREAIADVVKSEWGTFHVAPDGTLTFRKRQSRPLNVTVDLAITTGAWVKDGMDVKRARSEIANIVEVQVMPRKTGDVDAVLWTLEDTPSIGPGQSRVYVAHYTDVGQQAARVGATDIVDPLIENTDYEMNTQADGGGADLSGSFTVTIAPGANAADVTVTNDHATLTGYITLLQIRGTPLLTYQTVTMRAEDTTSQDTYGPCELALNMPIQDDPEVGRDLAEWLKNILKDPLTRVGSVSIWGQLSDAFMAAALGLDVNNQISITDPHTGLSGVAYFIEHVRHEITHGGQAHKATWQLSPAVHSAMWILGEAGKSELGETTFLGF